VQEKWYVMSRIEAEETKWPTIKRGS